MGGGERMEDNHLLKKPFRISGVRRAVVATCKYLKMRGLGERAAQSRREYRACW